MQVKKTALIALVKKAGLDPNGDDWKQYTGPEAAEDSTDELPAANFLGLSNNLLSLEAAKAHPEVENAFKGKLFGVVDTKLAAHLKSLGLDDAAIKAATDGVATPDRIAKAIDAAVAKAKGDGKQSDDQREKQWQTDRQKLETDLKTANDTLATAQQTLANERRDTALGAYLGDPKRFALRSDVPNIGRYAKQEILDAIANDGAQLVIKNGQPFLAMKDDAEKPFHRAGQAAPVVLDDFFKATLDQAGFINKQPGNQQQQLNQPFGGGDGQGGQGGQPGGQGGQPSGQAAASMAANLAIMNQMPADQPSV